MKTNLFIIAIVLLATTSFNGFAFQSKTKSRQSIIIDHTCTQISQIPLDQINAAKQNLVIAYGHTSHGSQLITGMDGLDNFMSAKGYNSGTFSYSGNGDNNSLQLRDCPFAGAEDLGNPDRSSWAAATRNYLNEHTEVNVIMWSWCGQAGWASNDEIDLYLSLMNELETDFPNVSFVYMTGHLDGTGENGQLNQNNQRIRDFCKNNNKILYDFADIESFDPDGETNYMLLYANDNCDYTTKENEDRNWATDWQNSHTEGVDWYGCSAAHSQALVGNLKAYAAWWLFARLAGWDNEQTTKAKQIKVAPTDAKAYVSRNAIHFNIDSDEYIEQAMLFDQQGKTVFSTNQLLNNIINIDLLNTRGILFYRITTNTKKKYTGRVMLSSR